MLAKGAKSATSSVLKHKLESGLVTIPDDMMTDESDFLGDNEQRSFYRGLAASYDPQQYWDVHRWNVQVLATKGQEALVKATPKRGRESEGPDDIGPRDRPPEKTAKTEQHGNFNESDNTRSRLTEGDRTISERRTSPISPDASNESSTSSSTEERKPQNYYEGLATAKQLSETVGDFLNRLPPSKTPHTSGSWIWIANPYPSTFPAHNQSETGDIAGFKQAGFRVLEEFTRRREEIEAANPGKPAGSITRILRPERLKLEPTIIRLAKEHRVTNGKWMLFPLAADVDRVWSIVAHATWDGKLGIAAKVATDNGEDVNEEKSLQRLICIYTYDFSEKEDVKRVLRNMKTLGLLDDEETGQTKTVYYKCDAYTYLDLGSGNEYKLKASMYNSRDLLKE